MRSFLFISLLFLAACAQTESSSKPREGTGTWVSEDGLVTVSLTDTKAIYSTASCETVFGRWYLEKNTAGGSPIIELFEEEKNDCNLQFYEHDEMKWVKYDPEPVYPWQTECFNFEFGDGSNVTVCR